MMWKFLVFQVFVSLQPFSCALLYFLSLCIQERICVALLRSKCLIYNLNHNSQIVQDTYLHNLIYMRTQALNMSIRFFLKDMLIHIE